MIRAADTYFFKRHVTRLFTISAACATGWRSGTASTGEVLHPPPPQRAYRCDEYGDYFFFTSRLSPLKRADLILRALAQPEARGVRCVIGGEGEDEPRLRKLARELGLGDRVDVRRPAERGRPRRCTSRGAAR